jgi:hypothetical protein
MLFRGTCAVSERYSVCRLSIDERTHVKGPSSFWGEFIGCDLEMMRWTMTYIHELWGNLAFLPSQETDGRSYALKLSLEEPGITKVEPKSDVFHLHLESFAVSL